MGRGRELFINPMVMDNFEKREREADFSQNSDFRQDSFQNEDENNPEGENEIEKNEIKLNQIK